MAISFVKPVPVAGDVTAFKGPVLCLTFDNDDTAMPGVADIFVSSF